MDLSFFCRKTHQLKHKIGVFVKKVNKEVVEMMKNDGLGIDLGRFRGLRC